MQMQRDEVIPILDFGSQYAQLIARRVREKGVYSELVRPDISVEDLKKLNPVGIILSGGPSSVYVEGAPRCDPRIFDMGIPVLGICYGMQLGAYILGGEVKPAAAREFGRAKLHVTSQDPLVHGLPDDTTVWMSHGDQVHDLPKDFIALAATPTCPFAAAKHKTRPFWGVQFHPEVTHTPRGALIFENFLYEICKAKGDWTMGNFVEQNIRKVREQVGSGKVICGLSGGVDSSVVAALLHKAIGDQLVCIFVDNGLLRKNERELVERTFRDHFHINLITSDASEQFLRELKGVTDPQQKRKIIGREFIEAFKREAKSIDGAAYLAQGTLYPDVIESGHGYAGTAANIKLHHNVGGLPAELGFELVEPLRELFKDEVRKVGEVLGLPENIVWRHPFPGPGLAVRIIGDITPEKLRVLRDADEIVLEELVSNGLYRKTSQVFAALLPIGTVGVMGDARSYDSVVAIRAVESEDFMTADWSRLPYDVLATMSNRIINEVRGVNRVVYDISSKPPATIEWE
ncbi:glutamine-hydrolyzing GMP synthase [Humisphaera borealis]|uniref:GMP synthase [glutamine-hydrolyzing] n=2 Tax=Humisphaera borealis TaxID=2807512 RepID=A0A7M2X6H2_9BACT|nr:glutamine-hydrolyzing GMP synthase [Humisphaera borealis]